MLYFPKCESGANFLFIGEAGSGKSEIAVNFANYLGCLYPNTIIDFFDLDQTKPLFRSRDYLKKNTLSNLKLHFEHQFLDTPITAPGLQEALADSNHITITDAGGNTTGTRMIARFSQAFINTNTCVYFVINPYRPWSSSQKALKTTITQLCAESRLPDFHYISNPTLGANCSAKDILEGHHQVLTMLQDGPVEWMAVKQGMEQEIVPYMDTPVFPVLIQ